VLSPGKALTDPLLIALVVSIVSILLAMRRSKDRRLLGIALVSLLMLAVVSLPIGAVLLERSLYVDAPDGVPDVIVVPSGGMSGRALSGSSAARVVAAVEWWHEHPRARIVLSGADLGPGGRSTRTAELMRELALMKGVPAAQTALELESNNTREHAAHLPTLPGITPETHIGVVTSAWHLRRALQAFRRQFGHVSGRGADPIGFGPPVVNDFLPSSDSLRTSTVMLHEWIGIAWYALRR
jgi:uncharacterized SAM-binding protein YcdF (DUF218 family)